ncbi:MAG TPA: hypothetical protein VFQ51_10460, partial [Vicinamibacteria bacterium]|nr:hypothetical protein [Vicinamibacteria bacterium]
MSGTGVALANDFVRRRTLVREAAFAVLLALATFVAVRGLGRGPVTLAIGGFDAPWRGGPWGKALRADLDPPASRDGRLTFYFRPLRDGAALRLPVVPRGPMQVAFRARAMVRSSLGAFVQGVPVPDVLVDTGPWDRYVLEVPRAAARADGVTLALFLRARPVVAGAHAGRPEILVDEVTVESDQGLVLAWPFALVLAAAPLALALFGRALGLHPRIAWGAGLIAALVLVALTRMAPVPTVTAVP